MKTDEQWDIEIPIVVNFGAFRRQFIRAIQADALRHAAEMSSLYGDAEMMRAEAARIEQEGK